MTAMAAKKVPKRPDRQVTRRLERLIIKLFEFAELNGGIECLFMARNTKKKEVHSFLSSEDINWLGNVEDMIDHDSS
jgi:hypothetical protein